MTNIRIGVDVLDRRFFIECPVEEAGAIHALARKVDERARDIGTAADGLNDSELLLRVALDLMTDVEALTPQPDFAEQIDRLSRRVEALNARFTARKEAGVSGIERD